ncbi:DUF412 domain-containing protein [Neiella marina]|uniref:UPF0208 membrane protein YfbV n=1 Tax=Neiella holothuriorum TaxID=2870530 RepID=A0ABS7EJ97_9GAMM|nr:terminus macrodomain insulation protein YfbV [Neiella holothuriorum]MBW8192409.1 DUF412 domain-containing protein [Neiella holothuriorum]
MKMMQVFKDGQDYMRAWPMRPELALLMPENRIIQLTRKAQLFVPLFAVLAVSMPIGLNLTDAIPPAVASALLMLSLPLQGLYWLGKRSESPLSGGLRSWYGELHQSMVEQGCKQIPSRCATPKFRDLALVLKRAFESLEQFAKVDRPSH